MYNDSTYGIQIVSNDSLETVNLGSNDETVTAADFPYSLVDNDGCVASDEFKKASASYNNLYNNLDTRAKKYLDNEGIAMDARCIGSNPVLSGGKFQGELSSTRMYTTSSSNSYASTINNKWKATAEYHEKDLNQLNSLGIVLNGNNLHGIATPSRHAGGAAGNTYAGTTGFMYFGNEVLDVSTSLVEIRPSTTIGDHFRANNDPFDFCPVFLISSSAVVTGGDGSKDNPYILSRN